ncbi:Uncharacterized protein Fot_29647 [Forsythia ovata]|uniref:Uncharacterized protein n=1 Tax=Forsythia ovata TaxID=205694 RepID=A0ABD1TSG9_9LAMI
MVEKAKGGEGNRVDFCGGGVDAGEEYSLEGLGVGAGTGVRLIEGATGDSDGDGADVPFLNQGSAIGGDGGIPQIEDVPQVVNNLLEEEENALEQSGEDGGFR